MLSIIIPTYKPQAYLWECLDSISAQTLSKDGFEVLLILNGCNEPYKTGIEQYITERMHDVNIRLIQTDEAGVSNARNRGIEEAGGEYLAFIDDDDKISADYLEELMAQAAPETVVFSDLCAFDDATGTISETFYMHRTFQNNRFRHAPSFFAIRALLNSPWGKVFHRGIIGERRFNTKYKSGEDSLMMLEISNAIKHTKFASGKAVYFYRLRASSASASRGSIFARLWNSLKMMATYTQIILRSPLTYNYPFVLSRYAATLKYNLFD